MIFAKALALAGAVSSAAAAISIGFPNSNGYWVQFEENTITWTFSSSDPNPIDISVTNSNASLLQGNFSIATGVDLSNGTFTVTNVTLVTGDGYNVQFVNTSDPSQVFATSQSFSVMPNGTTPASTATGSSASSTGASGSGGSSGSATASGASSTSSSGALRTLGNSFDGALPIIVSAGIAAAGGLLAL